MPHTDVRELDEGVVQGGGRGVGSARRAGDVDGSDVVIAQCRVDRAIHVERPPWLRLAARIKRNAPSPRSLPPRVDGWYGTATFAHIPFRS